MARWSFKVAKFTPVAVADTTNFTDNGYMGLKGGHSLHVIRIHEIYIGELAAYSSPTIMLFSRDSTVHVTPTALAAGQSNASTDPGEPAPNAPAVAFTASTTKPQRSATLGLLNLSFNAFGGKVKWQSDEAIEMLGNVASFGEVSLSAYTGGTPGAIGAHIIYEPE